MLTLQCSAVSTHSGHGWRREKSPLFPYHKRPFVGGAEAPDRIFIDAIFNFPRANITPATLRPV